MKPILLIATMLALPPVLRAQEPAPPRAALGFDHVVVVVHDLKAAGADYARLGFSLKPGRPHPNGITNLHVKFPLGTELELLAVAGPVDRTTRFYSDQLKSGDGPAAVALFAPEPDSVPVVLRRTGLLATSSAGELGFPDAHPLRYVFFWHRNHSPTDRPEHFAHSNTADSVVALWLAADDADPEARLLSGFGAGRSEPAEPPVPGGPARVHSLADVRVVRFPAAAARPGRRVIGLTLHVRSVSTARGVLERAGVPFEARRSAPGRMSLYLSPESAHGLWLELVGEVP